MTKKAFDKIAAGLNEAIAIAIARGGRQTLVGQFPPAEVANWDGRDEMALAGGDVTPEAIEVLRQKAAPYIDGKKWEVIDEPKAD